MGSKTKRHNRINGIQLQRRIFQCPDCESKITAPKSKTKGNTKEGHIKTMWCYPCSDEKDFVQQSIYD